MHGSHRHYHAPHIKHQFGFWKGLGITLCLYGVIILCVVATAAKHGALSGGGHTPIHW